MRLIIEALSLEDSSTILHSKNVGSLIIGLQDSILRVTQGQKYINRVQFINTLKAGGIMHDIGKVKIPSVILNKNGNLSDYEYDVVKKHTLYGLDLINQVPTSKDINRGILANMVVYHHERWDGTGYPFNLRGSEIPVEARITSIIDTYEAIRAVRPYKKAKSHEYAIEEIERCSGTQFDPHLVKEFISQERLMKTLYDISCN